MLRFLGWFALAAVLLAVRPTWSQTTPVPDRDAQAIRAVIEAQLAAFSQDDAERAFSFASDSIQTMFGTPENFMTMVKTSYAVVYRPASVLFLELERLAEETHQAVHMSDGGGQMWLAIYRMQRQPDNSWRISGCVIRLMEGAST
jgi:hypothetical protein